MKATRRKVVMATIQAIGATLVVVFLLLVQDRVDGRTGACQIGVVSPLVSDTVTDKRETKKE
jgi:hypothetical protein